MTILERREAGSIVPEYTELPYTPENRFAFEVGPAWRVDRELQWFSEWQPVDLLPYCPESHLRKLDPDERTEDLFILENVLHSVDHLQDIIHAV